MSLPTSLPDDTLEADATGQSDPTWLRQAVEREAEFSDARIKLTGKLLRNVFALLLVACALYSGHGYSHGHVDTGPLMGCFLLPPLMEYNRRWPHDRRLRQGCVVMSAIYLHLRLWPWHLLIAEGWPVPPTVKEGYVSTAVRSSCPKRALDGRLIPWAAHRARPPRLGDSHVIGRPTCVEWDN